MKKLLFSTIFCILIFLQSAYCQLFTCADDYPVSEYGYIDSLGTWDYRLVYKNDYRIGDINLKSASIAIKPHGSYLDIIETAAITLTAKDETYKYSIDGTISLPKNASISSFYISDGKKEYSAKILSVFSNNSIDTSLGDAVATLKLASRAGTDTPFDEYNLKIFNSFPATEYTVKIRYLSPNSADASSPYSVNLLCRSNSKNPSQIEINYSTSANETSYLLYSNGLKYQLTDGMSLQLPFQYQLQLIPINQISSKFHTTDIAEGAWKGKYLLLNTTIPDSVRTLLGKPIETIVLWRWNNPNSFVTRHDYGGGEYYKYISNYGNQAITQSKAIKELAVELSNTGNQTGLVHSIPKKAPMVFPLCKEGSAAYAKLEMYLDQFTSDYFINSGYYESDIKPDDPKDTLADSAKFEFLKSMKIVRGLYSNGQGIMKHLIILSCGPVPISRDLVSLEELDTLFTNISVDKRSAVWRDINFSIIGNIALKRNFISVGSFNMPEYKPTSILLKVSTSSKNYNFPLSPDQSSFSIIAKSENAWNPQLTWTGYDASGSITSTATSIANVYSTINDTGLIKLWAFNNERLTEKKESNLGYNYGVISEDNCMKIFPTFKGYDSTATEFAVAINYYSSDHPISVKNNLMSNGLAFRCIYHSGLLHITLPGNKQIKRIRLYSLTGKLIADFDPAHFKVGNSYIIELSRIQEKSFTASSMVLVRIDGEDMKFAQKILIK